MDTNRQTKVLVVEDELPLAMLMANFLYNLHCDARVACNGKMAIELAGKQSYLEQHAGQLPCGRALQSPFDSSVSAACR